MYVKTRSPIWLVGPIADRPLATDFRGTYTADDEDGGTTYRSDGATWTQVGAGVSAAGGAVAAEDVTVDSTTLVGTGTDVQAVLEELDNAVAASQPLDATLTALAAANWAANSLPVGSGADTLSQLSMGASTILARLAAGNVVAATPSQLRTLLSLVIGTDVQAYDADLTTYAGITPSANVQSLLAAANYAAMRTLLALVPGTDVIAVGATAGGDLTGTLPSPRVALMALKTDSTFYYVSNGAVTTGTKTAATMYAYPLWLPGGATIDRIGLEVTIGGAAGSVHRLGVYNDAGGYPGTRLVDGGTVNSTGTGNLEVTVSAAVPNSGWYWLAAAPQVNNATIRIVSGAMPLLTRTTFATAPGSTSAVIGYSVTGVTAGLPDPFGSTPLTEVTNSVPRVYVRLT